MPQVLDLFSPQALRLRRRATPLTFPQNLPSTVRRRMAAAIDLGQAVITGPDAAAVLHAGT